MPCKPEADACAPGLTCLQEACGNDLGRCYRFCRPDAQTTDNVCGAGVCGTPVLLPDRSDSQQRVCDLAGQTCDAYLGTGCVDPALVCYAAGPSQSTCDCPSGANVAVGAPCTLYNDCASGLACLNFAAGGDGTSSGSSCVKLCQTDGECPGSLCQPFAPTFGYCKL